MSISRRARVFVITFAVAIALGAIALIMLFAATNANAGQTGGFAPYARQGIIDQLHHIYGNGNPYKVKCTEVDHISNLGVINDTVICKVTG